MEPKELLQIARRSRLSLKSPRFRFILACIRDFCFIVGVALLVYVILWVGYDLGIPM